MRTRLTVPSETSAVTATSLTVIGMGEVRLEKWRKNFENEKLFSTPLRFAIACMGQFTPKWCHLCKSEMF